MRIIFALIGLIALASAQTEEKKPLINMAKNLGIKEDLDTAQTDNAWKEKSAAFQKTLVGVENSLTGVQQKVDEMKKANVEHNEAKRAKNTNYEQKENRAVAYIAGRMVNSEKQKDALAKQLKERDATIVAGKKTLVDTKAKDAKDLAKAIDDGQTEAKKLREEAQTQREAASAALSDEKQNVVKAAEDGRAELAKAQTKCSASIAAEQASTARVAALWKAKMKTAKDGWKTQKAGLDKIRGDRDNEIAKLKAEITKLQGDMTAMIKKKNGEMKAAVTKKENECSVTLSEANKKSNLALTESEKRAGDFRKKSSEQLKSCYAEKSKVAKEGTAALVAQKSELNKKAAASEKNLKDTFNKDLAKKNKQMKATITQNTRSNSARVRAIKKTSNIRVNQLKKRLTTSKKQKREAQKERDSAVLKMEDIANENKQMKSSMQNLAKANEVMKQGVLTNNNEKSVASTLASSTPLTALFFFTSIFFAGLCYKFHRDGKQTQLEMNLLVEEY